jgi:hypothetical protein
MFLVQGVGGLLVLVAMAELEENWAVKPWYLCLLRPQKSAMCLQHLLVRGIVLNGVES